jgi:hypothetical protein
MLGRLQARGYRFAAFGEAEKSGAVALLRHDIDFDVAKAAAMASIEAEMGVQSTYFFLLTSGHYNMLSRETIGQVRGILEQGHWLGLHFDCAAYPGASIAEFGEACRREAETLEQWYGTPVEIVSFHRPSQGVLTGDPAYAGGRQHTYQAEFTKTMCYRSDSRSQWREGLPTEAPAFERGEPLHILVHPIWWDDSGDTPVGKLKTYMREQQEALDQSVEANCTIYHRQGP